MKVLVVVAHPDDEAFGCGGRVAKLSDAGHEVSVLLPTRRCDPRGRDTWGALVEAFHRSCSLLGARSIVLEDLLEETLAEPQVHELQNRIYPFVRNAELVLTHWPGDVNQVHRGVARAVEIATRPFRFRCDVSCFEVPTSTDQGFAGVAPAFQPSEYVLLSADQADRKCTAASLYTRETAPGRTAEDLARRMRVRGAQVGADLAEAYVVARLFR
jgi:LmbE family N-acetylglucosaminyl deacetylase